MRLAKLVMVCALAAAVCAGCGIKAKPLAGAPHIDRAPGNHARVLDPRYKHVKCLRQHHYRVRQYYVGTLPAFQVGTAPGSPTVVFEATPGGAQFIQIQGGANGAMVIGAALVYPNSGSAHKLFMIAKCVGYGVIG